MLSALIAEIENYWLSVAELEAWLAAGEAKIEECGPFGADLPRLVEQSALLEVWEASYMNHNFYMAQYLSHHHSNTSECHTITVSHHHSMTVTPHSVTQSQLLGMI